jgi:IPT/TIG domain
VHEKEGCRMKRRRRLSKVVAATALAGSATLWLGVPAAHAAAPTVTSFNPTSGVVGATVVIAGSGFNDSSVATGVTFNGTTATFTVNSNVQITATVPAGATDGPIAVVDSEGTGTSATNFDVTPSPVPTITSFNPTSGPVGTSVVITGTGFTGATAVTFGGTAATAFTVDSDTQITATVPTGATTGQIVVTTPGGTAMSTTDFTVTGGTPTEHGRSVSLNLRRHLVARGHVGSSFDACESNVTVKIQRRGGGRWRTIGTDTTDADGDYRETVADRVGRYRVVVPRFAPDADNVCVRDVSSRVRHLH